MRSQPARADLRLTYDDFLLFPNDGKRHEIIDGEHYVTPSPNVRHQELVLRLALVIDAAVLAAEDNDTLTTPLLPGCAIALRALFAPS